MSPEEAKSKKDQLKCFYCLSDMKNHPNILIVSEKNGVVEIRNWREEMAPMVFCSSDCLYGECNYRYQDRVARGTIKTRGTTPQAEGVLPSNWQGDKEKALREGAVGVYTSHLSESGSG